MRRAAQAPDVGLLLALGSSVAYGLADYFGGMLSRRGGFIVVALLGQSAGLVLSLLVVLLQSPAPAGVTDLAWGALSGVGTGVGMLFLYRGMSRGDMSAVVPIAAVGGAALPVVIGVGLLGERPSVLSSLGIVAAIPAIWFISRSRTTTVSGGPKGIADAMVASGWIALQYTALAQAGADAGLWPIVSGRVAAVLCIVPVVLAGGRRHRLPRLELRVALGAAATGATATLALLLYMLATRQELMTIAVVLSSLCPAIPVLLGATLLHERIGPRRALGLAAAAVAIVLVATG